MGAIGRMVTSTPFLEDQSTPTSWNPITPCWTPGSEEASFTSPVVTDAVGRYNEAMDTIASLTTQEQVEREPLKYQLKTPFQNLLRDGEQLKVKKAEEDCLHVCNVIAPGNGEELFERPVRLDMENVDHFVEFIDRPYFYQDVSYGNKVLTLDNGDRIDKVYND